MLKLIGIAGISLLVGPWLSGCEGGGDTSTDGNTNWFGVCVSNAACSKGLECLCGLCTKPCAKDDQCGSKDWGCAVQGSDSFAARCRDAKYPPGGVCLATCGEQSCGAGDVCIGGLCAPNPSRDGGTAADGAIDGRPADAGASRSTDASETPPEPVDGGPAPRDAQARRDASLDALADSPTALDCVPDGGLPFGKYHMEGVVGDSSREGPDGFTTCSASTTTFTMEISTTVVLGGEDVYLALTPPPTNPSFTSSFDFLDINQPDADTIHVHGDCGTVCSPDTGSIDVLIDRRSGIVTDLEYNYGRNTFTARMQVVKATGWLECPGSDGSPPPGVPPAGSTNALGCEAAPMAVAGTPQDPPIGCTYFDMPQPEASCAADGGITNGTSLCLSRTVSCVDEPGFGFKVLCCP